MTSKPVQVLEILFFLFFSLPLIPLTLFHLTLILFHLTSKCSLCLLLSHDLVFKKRLCVCVCVCWGVVEVHVVEHDSRGGASKVVVRDSTPHPVFF
mgnify:CR=1 FL=1